MGSLFRSALVLLTVFTALLGLAYPAAITGIARIAFPDASRGWPVRVDGSVMGARLVGQPFDDPRYFHGRPSATLPFPYNAAASSGSNLGPTNPALRDAVEARIAALRASDPDNDAPVPVDLVTASASGLDPDISPAAAYWQAARVARARGLPVEAVRALIDGAVEGRTLGVLGEPRVNVLALNLALDRVSARVAPPSRR